ncbi:hypothetical protein BB558_006523 [Smittium angustum]|uniref:Reverse transcriptase domain-containing protein n=1 Tax=Smittium angustum TaxID=133377 RepID=A0A2U1IXH3_SMIAN|nr:hypothetical protein BB558_006523 [Smittium angustum]
MDQNNNQDTTSNMESRMEQLTEMVAKLLKSKMLENTQIVEVDPHITERARITELECYLQLLEALSSIEEDFFRTALMNYTPPTINDSAPTTAKRADGALYNLQSLDIPDIRMDNSKLIFASTMRVLLAEIASSISQSRIEGLHNVMQFPGKAPQITPTTVEPLLDNKVLAELVAQKKLARSARKKPFLLRHQQYNVPATTVQTAQSLPEAVSTPQYQSTNTGVGEGVAGKGPSRRPIKVIPEGVEESNTFFDATAIEKTSKTITAQDGTKSSYSTKKGNISAISKASNFRDMWKLAEILFKYLYCSQEKRRFEISSQPQIIEPASRKEMFQNGIIKNSLPDYQKKGLHGIYRSGRRFYAYSNSTELQKVSEIPVECRKYKFRVLPFEMALSPLVFTKILKPAIKWASKQGIRVAAYLNNLLVL